MDYRRKARLPGHSVRILLFNAKGCRAADADVMGTPHRYRDGACRSARAVRRPRYPRAQSPVTTRRRGQPFGGESNAENPLRPKRVCSATPRRLVAVFLVRRFLNAYAGYLFCFYIFVGIHQFTPGTLR